MKQKQAGGSKDPIKTWARASQIPPEFVGHTFLVHQGKNFITVFVSEGMVGHRLGEFAPTRTFRMHSGQRKTAAPAKAVPAQKASAPKGK